MKKSKLIYVCVHCGAQAAQWAGRCHDCGGWNSLQPEASLTPARTQARGGYAGASENDIQLLSEVALSEQSRVHTGMQELDRVLGGGLVKGSVVLIGGDPGIGKSTLLLQILCYLSEPEKVLYVTGEESIQQIALRARRLELNADKVSVLAETQVETMIAKAREIKPTVMVVDSIQTIYSECLPSAPGSVSQVRESAAALVRYAKNESVVIFLVGHVTKEGSLAGPRVLEHIVDTVLYFEGDSDSRYRILRAFKNRFGAVNEVGVFAMLEQGLKEVKNPSSIFLSRRQIAVSGSSVLVSWEGSRPLLVECQALVDKSYLANPRRVAVGVDASRLALLLAVLSRHGGISFHDQDVFVNVVGGVRISETSADVALLLAVCSSLRDTAIAQDWVAMGEVGLAGEIRPVTRGVERLQEAMKHGFKRALVSPSNMPRQAIPGLEVIPIATVKDALNIFQ